MIRTKLFWGFTGFTPEFQILSPVNGQMIMERTFFYVNLHKSLHHYSVDNRSEKRMDKIFKNFKNIHTKERSSPI